MTTLGAFLLERGAASMADLEESMRRQMLYGGDVGAHLLSQGVLDEARLLSLLAEYHDLPLGPAGKLPPMPAELEQLLPTASVQRYRVFPLGTTRNELHVATAEPLDDSVAQELTAVVGQPLRQVVVTPLRMCEALWRYLLVPLAAAYRETLGQIDGPEALAEPARLDRDYGAVEGPKPYRRMIEDPSGKIRTAERVPLGTLASPSPFLAGFGAELGGGAPERELGYEEPQEELETPHDFDAEPYWEELTGAPVTARSGAPESEELPVTRPGRDHPPLAPAVDDEPPPVPAERLADDESSPVVAAYDAPTVDERSPAAPAVDIADDETVLDDESPPPRAVVEADDESASEPSPGPPSVEPAESFDEPMSEELESEQPDIEFELAYADETMAAAARDAAEAAIAAEGASGLDDDTDEVVGPVDSTPPAPDAEFLAEDEPLQTAERSEPDEWVESDGAGAGEVLDESAPDSVEPVTERYDGDLDELAPVPGAAPGEPGTDSVEPGAEQYEQDLTVGAVRAAYADTAPGLEPLRAERLEDLEAPAVSAPVSSQPAPAVQTTAAGVVAAAPSVQTTAAGVAGSDAPAVELAVELDVSRAQREVAPEVLEPAAEGGLGGEPDEAADSSGAGAAAFLHRGPFSRLDAERAAAEAADVTELLGILMRFSRQYFERLVLFVVQSGHAEARLARGVPPALEGLRVSLAEPSVLQRAHDELAIVVEHPVPEGIDALLLQGIAADQPIEVAVVPVRVRRRVIALLFADDGGVDVARDSVAEVSGFANVVGNAVALQILRRKRLGPE